MLFHKKKLGCPHHGEKVTKVIEREKVYYTCDFCHQPIMSWQRKLMNVWIKYQVWRGEGYSFTSFVKEFMLNMVQGGMIMTTLKVIWDITLSWHWLAIFFVLWEIFNVWLGNRLIYKIRLPEAMSDYYGRSEALSPVQRGMLDDLVQIKKDIKEIKNEKHI